MGYTGLAGHHPLPPPPGLGFMGMGLPSSSVSAQQHAALAFRSLSVGAQALDKGATTAGPPPGLGALDSAVGAGKEGGGAGGGFNSMLWRSFSEAPATPSQQLTSPSPQLRANGSTSSTGSGPHAAGPPPGLSTRPVDDPLLGEGEVGEEGTANGNGADGDETFAGFGNSILGTLLSGEEDDVVITSVSSGSAAQQQQQLGRGVGNTGQGQTQSRVQSLPAQALGSRPPPMGGMQPPTMQQQQTQQQQGLNPNAAGMGRPVRYSPTMLPGGPPPPQQSDSLLGAFGMGGAGGMPFAPGPLGAPGMGMGGMGYGVSQQQQQQQRLHQMQLQQQALQHMQQQQQNLLRLQRLQQAQAQGLTPQQALQAQAAAQQAQAQAQAQSQLMSQFAGAQQSMFAQQQQQRPGLNRPGMPGLNTGVPPPPHLQGGNVGGGGVGGVGGSGVPSDPNAAADLQSRLLALMKSGGGGGSQQPPSAMLYS